MGSLSYFRVFVAVFLTSVLACNRSSIVLQQHVTLTNNLVVLPVRVSGSQELPFILDTGASVSVIDRPQAESLGLAAPPAKLEFDTGKTGALTLVRQYVDKYPLLRPGQHEVAITAGALLPGKVPAAVARIQGLQLGRFTVNDVLTMIVPDRDAADVSGTTVGILGGELLKRFTVVLDYSRKQVILEPFSTTVRGIRLQDFQPMEFDMSGISLAAQGTDYRDYVVRAVIPGSPAAEADVAGGDHLTAVNGKPARDMT